MKTIILSLFSLLITAAAMAQTDATLADQAYLDIGIEYGIAAGAGGNIGYTNLGAKRWGVSHFGISFLYKDDGIDKHGERYDNIGQRQFSEDIVDEGYSFITASGLVGIKVSKAIHVLGIVGYQGANLVQRRFDRFTILGNNGRYYTEYRDPDRSSVGAGAGVKFFLPLSDRVAFTPTLQATTLKNFSLSLGLAFTKPR